LPPIQQTNPETPDKITSEYEEGILTVHLPKNPNVKTEGGADHGTITLRCAG